MAYPKTYKTDKGVYEIPEKESASFLKDFPNAMEVVSYKMGKDTFDIPVKETEVFIKENPQAVPLKKKEPSDNGLQEPSDGGLDGTIPTITQDELDKQDDVIGKIQEADALSKKTRFWGMGGGGGEVPDFDAIAKSKEIHNQLKGIGYGDNDIEILTKTFSDLPKEAEQRSVKQQDGTVAYPYSKKSFLELYKSNPIAAVTKANNVKNFYELRNAAGEGKASEYNSLAYVNDETKPINVNIDNFNQLKERQKELINTSLPKEKKQKALDRVEENSDIILSDIFQDEDNAKNYLIGKLQQKDATLKLSNPTVMEAEGKLDGDLSKFSLESIAENLDPKNKAEKLAFRKYKYTVDLDNALNSSADLNQAAVTFAAEQNPQIKGQIEKLGGTRLPNAYEGEIVNQFLNSPDVIKRAEQDPEFAEKYNQTKNNLYFNYPEFAKKEVATKISQAMEDRGMTNWFANIPTKEGTDKLVDDLVRTGELTEQDKLVYEKRIRDDLGVWQSVKRGVGRIPFGAFIEESPIQTPGLLESTQNSFNKTIHGVARSVEDIINIPAGGEAFSAKERLYSKLQEDATMINLIPKSTLHEVSMGTGHLAGFVIPMMAGGAALRGVKGAEFISNGLMFEGENKSNALKLFPDDPTKQYAYTAIATAGDMMLGHLIPKGDAAKGISKTLKGDIVDVVNKFTNKEITAAQAKQTLLNKTTSLLGDLAKENTKVAGTITGFGVFHNTLDALFGVNNMGAGDIATKAVKDFKSTYLTTPMLAAMAVKGRASGIDGKVLMEVASNPELYKKVIAEQSALNPELKATEKERLQNLEDAAFIKKDLDNTEMNDKQKEEFMITAINKKILERKAASITDKTLKQSVLDQAEKHDTNLVLLKSEFGDKEFKDLTPEERDRIEPPKDHTVKTQPSGTEGKFTPVIINKKGEHEVLNKSFDTPEAAKVYGEETVKKRYFDENIKNKEEELPDLSQPIPELNVDNKGIPLTEIAPEEIQRQMQPITDRMAEIEREFENKGFKIDWDYDNEIQVTDKKGNQLEAEEIPTELHKIAAEYEKATSKLGEFSQSDFVKSLEQSRKRSMGEEVPFEEVGKKQIGKTTDVVVDEGVGKITLNYNEKGEHLAPNGNPSKLSEPDAKLVRTPEFKKDFGDWEKKDTDIVLDENGEPLKVYHGTAFDPKEGMFSEFDNAKNYFGFTFFSDNPNAAKEWARDRETWTRVNQHIVEAFIKIKKPEIKEYNGERLPNEDIESFKSKNVDGVILKNVIDTAEGKPIVNNVYGVKDKSQIKSLNLPKPEQSLSTKPEIKNEEPKVEIPIPKEEGGITETKTGQGVPETETGEGDKKGITHAAVAELRKLIDLPEYEGKPTEGHEQLIAEAQETISKDPEAASKVLEKIDNDREVSNKDNAILAVYKATLDKALEENPTKETLERTTKLAKSLDVSGTKLGKALESRKLIGEEDNLANFLMQKQAAQGTSLTEKQVKDEAAKYTELKAAKEALEKQLEQEREQHAKDIAELGINKAKAKAKREAKKSDEEYKAERKASVDAAREALKKLREGGLKSTIPGALELQAIAPHVKDFFNSLASQGVDKLDNIITQVHAEFKDVLDGLTKKNILDIVAGDFDQKKEKTKNEKTANIRLLKREVDLLKELERARKGEEKAKSETEKVSANRRIDELKKKIEEVQKLHKEKEDIEPVEDLSAGSIEDVAKYEAKLQRRIEKLNNDLKEGNYLKEPAKQPIFKKTRKAQILEDRVIDLENKIRHERSKDEYNKRSKTRKAFDKLMEVLGIKRLVQTALDMSTSFRQGATLLSPRQIDVWAKGFQANLQSIFSPKKFERIMYEIRHDQQYHEMMKDNVVFNDLGSADPNLHNEDFRKSFVYKIPLLSEPLKASNRSADAFLNVARYELYKKLRRNLESKGFTREADPKSFKYMGNWVMSMTGRGKMHSALEKPAMNAVLGNTFFGARLMASRFNLLNPVTYFDPRIPKEVRYEAMKDMVAFTTTMVTVATALSYTTGAKISLNPDDSDFLQLRYDDKVYDISGGLANYVRTGLRILKAGYTKATGTKYEGKEATKNAGQSVLNFFRNKLSPNTAYGVDAFFGGRYGEQFDPRDIYEIYPMYTDDFLKAIKEEGGVMATSTVLIPNILGIGYGSYASKGQIDKNLDDLLKRNLRSDEMNNEKIYNYNEGGRAVTLDEFEKFADKRDAEIEKDVKVLYNKGVGGTKYEDLTPEQVADEIKYIKATATRQVKEELFGKEKKSRADKKEQKNLTKEREEKYKKN